MPSLREISTNDSKNYAGRKGFGTRMFLKKLNFNDDGDQIPQVVADEGSQLFGIRDFRGPNIVTNPVVLTHNHLPGGFVHTVPGLRDAGSMEFEANFFPWAVKWQQEGSSGLMNSLTRSPVDDDETIMEGIVVLPSRRGNGFYFQGYASMMGPVTYPQENVISSPFGIKISGKPYVLTPYAYKGYTPSVGSPIDALSDIDFTPVGLQGPAPTWTMARVLSPGIFDLWSKPISAGGIAEAENWIASEIAGATDTDEGIGLNQYYVMFYACPWLG